MKVIAVNGSPRKTGNTHALLRTVLSELESEEELEKVVEEWQKAIEVETEFNEDEPEEDS